MRRRSGKRRSKNVRIARRNKTDRRDSFKKLAPAVAKMSALLCIVFALYFIATKVSTAVSIPEIPLTDIRFEGTGPLDHMQLLKKASISKGTNLLAVDLKEVRRKVLTVPLVKDAEVRRNFYTGELTIKLELRQAVALLNCNGIYGIDADGVVLEEMGRLSSYDLPLISGVRIKSLKPGQKIKSKNLQQALEIQKHVLSSNLESVVILSEINVRDLRNVILYVGGDGTQIRLGRDRFKDKIQNAVVILMDLRREGKRAEYIDFRFGTKGFVKHKK